MCTKYNGALVYDMDASSGVPHKKTDAFFECSDVTCFTELDSSGQDENRMRGLFVLTIIIPHFINSTIFRVETL
jgi:hypothetical protein